MMSGWSIPPRSNAAAPATPPRRSGHPGWAEYGYCASQSRDFWGPRLHLIATLGGLPIAFAITGAKADERQTLLGILDADPALAATRPRRTLHRRPAVLPHRLRSRTRRPAPAPSAPGPQDTPGIKLSNRVICGALVTACLRAC